MGSGWTGCIRGSGVGLTRRETIATLGATTFAPQIEAAVPAGSAVDVAVIGAGVFGAWTA